MPLNNPNITLTILPATSTISNDPQRVLFVGQMKTGTATAGALTTNIGNAGEENALFGATSMIAMMIRNFRLVNKVTQVDAISLADNAGGVAATGTLAVTGTATATGTLNIAIGSQYKYTLPVAVTTGDTATVVGASIATAISALTDAPFTAASVTGTVTVTSVHKGTFGNKVGYKIIGAIPAGIAIALTAPTNGATNPTLTNLFSVITGERYQTVVYPEGYALSTLTTELDTRFNFTNNILDGLGIQTTLDTYANFLSAVTAQNSRSLMMLGNKLISSATNTGGAILEFSDAITSQFAAIRALRFTTGANISQYVISTNGALDSFGGAAIASLPYFNTPFPLLALVDRGLGFSNTETTSLAAQGGSILNNNRTSTSIISGETFTTRKTDSAGNAETTFHYLNAVDTASVIREFYFNNLRARFAQCRLTQGDLIPNRNMANAQVISSYLDSLYQQLSGQDYVLTQAGATALAYFKANRTVTLDLSTGTVTITMLMPIVTQLRTIVATMQISFSTQG